MAEPIPYHPQPADVPLFSTPEQELQTLLERLHRRGVLRLANNLLGRLPEVGEQLVRGIDGRGGGNALQNLTTLIELLAHVPPEDVRRFSHAARQGVARAIAAVGDQQADPPGFSGVWDLVHDETLWRDIRPLVEGAKQFAAALREPQDRGPEPEL